MTGKARAGGVRSYPADRNIVHAFQLRSASPSDQGDLLDRDPRLSATVTARSTAYQCRQLFRDISRAAKLPAFTTDDGAKEIAAAVITIGCRGVPARAAMDAVAAMYLARWEKTDQKGYRLITGSKELDDVHTANSPFEQERFAHGLRFMADLDRLPAAQRSQMMRPSGGIPILPDGRPVPSVPIGELPPSMQQAVRQMVASLVKEKQAQGNDYNYLLPHLGQTQVRVEVDPRSGFRDYFVKVRFPGHVRAGMGFRINDYEQWKGRQEAARRARRRGGDDPQFTPVKFDVSQKDAKRLPALRKTVSLSATDRTLPEVLRVLHDHYGVSFLSDPPRFMPQRATFRLPPLPLGEALDKLTDIYADTEWEWRRPGFLLVRGPNHPVRNPDRGRTRGTGTTAPPPFIPVRPPR